MLKTLLHLSLIVKRQQNKIEWLDLFSPVKTGDLRQSQAPCPVSCAVDVLGVDEGLVIVEPVVDGLVLFRVKLNLNGLQGFHIQHIVCYKCNTI